MSTSKDINLLKPELQEILAAVQAKCAEKGAPLLVYCTYRSPKAQARLYREGRSLAKIMEKVEELKTTWNRPDLAQLILDVGPQHRKFVKTKSGPGQSYHNYVPAMAFDAVPMRNGELVWGDKEPDDAALWNIYGETAQECGLKWGGTWYWPDKPHCQMKGVDWRKLIGSFEWASF